MPSTEDDLRIDLGVALFNLRRQAWVRSRFESESVLLFSASWEQQDFMADCLVEESFTLRVAERVVVVSCLAGQDRSSFPHSRSQARPASVEG